MYLEWDIEWEISMAVAIFTVFLVGFILGGSTVYLVENHFRTINEQILKFAQNYPTISKTASSDAPFFMKV